MRYLLVGLLFCSIIACSQSKPVDVYDLLYKNVTKGLGRTQKVDSLSIIRMDTVSKRKVIVLDTEDAKWRLESAQSSYDNARYFAETYKSAIDMMNTSGGDASAFDSLYAESKKDVDNASKHLRYCQSKMDSLTKMLEEMKGDGGSAYIVLFEVYYTFNGRNDKTEIVYSFPADDNLDKVDNLLLRKLKYE